MNALHGSRRQHRGVSLIEALVALAVMAFGMLGVVGMQAALRTGADQSKQRSIAYIIRSYTIYYSNYVGVPPFALNGTANAREVIINYAASDVSATFIPGPYGFKLTSGGVIQARLPGNVARWQDLTDPKVMRITRFAVDLSSPASLTAEVIPCPKLCPGGDTACWPRVIVRELAVVIEAEAASDASVKRAVTSYNFV